MGAEKDIIVALELGSSAIRAIAGRKKPDGSMLVLAIAQEKNTNAIRKGMVDNMDKTTQAISNVKEQLEHKLNTHIIQVYVGISGQSLRTTHNKVAHTFQEKKLITGDIIDDMLHTNLGVLYPNAQILEAIPQEYLISNRLVADPVGMQSESIEAHYANITLRPNICKDIENCIRNAGLEIAGTFISPLALADCIFTNSDKRSGCALADIGADTTTIAFYDGGVLRHLIVIPMGGSNVTKDIASENIDIEEAEELKLKYGTAYNSDEAINAEKIAISHGREIYEQKLKEITEARYEELILNIWEQVKGKGKLLSGITFVGGASRIKDFTTAFSKHTKSEIPARLAKDLPENISPDLGIQLTEVENLQTLMGLLLKGTEPCVGDAPKEQDHVQTVIDFETHIEPEEKEPEEKENKEKPKQTPANEEGEKNQNTPQEPEKPKTSFSAQVGKLWKKFISSLEDESED